MGNLGSIQNMLNKIEVDCKITHSSNEIDSADKLILPGVGAFDHGMDNLTKNNLINILYNNVIVHKKPILGICLGMQLLFEHSEEGNIEGLCWIPGRVKRFSFDNMEKKVPHMGWNTINIETDNLLLDNLHEDSRFYFVHSFFAVCQDKKNVLATTSYGHSFCSIVNNANIYGVQFHPEKSHRYGMKLLKNFALMR